MKNKYIIGGIFIFIVAILMWKNLLFSYNKPYITGIIGGTDGPTAVYVAGDLAKYYVWRLTIIAGLLIITIFYSFFRRIIRK